MSFAAIDLINDLLARERKARADAEVERRGRLIELRKLDRRIAEHEETIQKLESTRADQVRATIGLSGPPRLTRKEIAAAIGRAPETVRSRIQTALKKDPTPVVRVPPHGEAAYSATWCRRHFPSLAQALTEGSWTPHLGCDGDNVAASAELNAEDGMPR